MSYVVGADCILCGACISGCEVGAVTEGEIRVIIDAELCVECGTCEANCPCRAISFEEDVRVGNV
jgi:ferredoxin